jgi:hypothetical protein
MCLVNVEFVTYLFILQLHHLQEEMVIVKECYAQCNEAKTQLTQDLVSLQQEYSNVMSSTSVVSNSTAYLFKLLFFL